MLTTFRVGMRSYAGSRDFSIFVAVAVSGITVIVSGSQSDFLGGGCDLSRFW